MTKRWAALFAILIFGALARPAQAQDSTADVYCTPEQVATCSGTTWGPLHTAGGHHCSWSGLTIKCVDEEIQYCALPAGGTCPLDPSTNPNVRRTVPGIYQISDFVTQFVRVSQWGLGFVMVLAVLMFVWAGWQFVTAGGREHQIDEGKRIMTGTVTGIIISLSAYVIINFAVYALTGATSRTQDGGFLGVLFPNSQEFRRIFSGDNTSVETRTSCRSANNSTWEKGCSDHILCADSGESSDLSGSVAQLQKKLNDLHCGCGTVDGCFGTVTTDCVRKFQIANNLAPSGVVNPATAAAVTSTSAVACDNVAANASAVMSNLPGAIIPKGLSGGNTDDAGGCCIVSNGTDDLYCLQDVSLRTCKSLNASDGNTFLEGKTCAGSNTNNRCGFCQSADIYAAGADRNCYEFATPSWCQARGRDSAGNPLSFRASTCEFRCDGACRTTLMTQLR